MKRMFTFLIIAALVITSLPVCAEDISVEIQTSGDPFSDLLQAVLEDSLNDPSSELYQEIVGTATNQLTADTWTSESGEAIAFQADGTAVLTMPDSDPITGTYTREGDTITFSYQLYGQRTLVLTLEEKNGAYQLKGEHMTYYSAAALAMLKAEKKANSNAYALKWGEKIKLGFVTMTLDTAQVFRSLSGTSGVGMIEPAKDGTRYFALVGTLKNSSGASMNRKAVAVTMIFDERDTYAGKIYVDYNGSLVSELPASGEGTLYMYAALPEQVAAQFKTVSVVFGFDERFSSNPSSPDGCAYQFALEVDETLAEQSRQEPPKEKTFYEDSPSLPVPTSYADVKQSTYNKSTVNKKVKSIKYTYRKTYDSDSGEQVFGKYINGLKADGYTVTKSKGVYTIKNGKKILATVSYDNSKMTVEVEPGNEKLKTLPKATAPANNSGAAFSFGNAKEEKTYKLGDTLKTDYASLKLSEQGSGNKVYSYVGQKKKPNKWYYYEADSGNSLIYVLGNFKNQQNNEVDVRRIYVEMTIDGNHYTCRQQAIRKDRTSFFDVVESQGSYPILIWAEVPSSIAKSFKSCTLTVGFDENYGLHYTRNGRLDFDMCDQVFAVKIK